MASKANKCGINNIEDGVEVCWGISKYGSHTYKVKYTITNFIAELNDSQMVYWNLIPRNLVKNNGSVNITIYAEKFFKRMVKCHYVPHACDMGNQSGLGRFCGKRIL